MADLNEVLNEKAVDDSKLEGISGGKSPYFKGGAKTLYENRNYYAGCLLQSVYDGLSDMFSQSEVEAAIKKYNVPLTVIGGTAYLEKAISVSLYVGELSGGPYSITNITF